MDKSSHPSPSAVREQIERLQRSVLFAGSDRLIAFLRFVVDGTLDGGAATLKEAVIGNAVYGREPPYDPRIDSTVRVEARRLRSKLQDYYAGEGRDDPVRIDLPTGGYVPFFAANRSARQKSGPADEPRPVFGEGAGTALAIMPIRALSRDAGIESFADGLTDELMFALGRSQGMNITSRGLVFAYKDKPYSSAQLAVELGVDAILQGTVRGEGDIIRVTIEVSNPTGFVLWSDRFDARSEERLVLQEKIAATALSRMRFDNSQMRARRQSPSPQAVEAYAKIYRARQLLDEQSPAALYEALDLFSEVSRTAPDYARGPSGVADCYCDLFRLGLIDHATAAAGARPAAQRALEIDAQSSEAHTAVATIFAWLDWNRPAAEANYRKALRLSENARAARLYGVLLTNLERHEEAERLFREARSIEPFSVQQDIAEAVCHYQSRRHGPMAQMRAGERRPFEALLYQALGAACTGDPASARSLLPELDFAAPKYPHLMFACAEIEARIGVPERALRLLAGDMGTATCFGRATLAAAVDDDDRSLDELTAALERRELAVAWLRTDARFDRLRGSARFSQLLDGLDAFAAGGEYGTA